MMGSPIAIVVLAAGSSSRLGQPKQLVQFNGQSLLQHVIGESLKLENAVVVVVTGANREVTEKQIASPDIQIVFNEHWKKGMGSSIACGLRKLMEISPKTACCILAVTDQPFISAAIFRELIEEQAYSKKGIVASEYAQTFGTPALFSKKYFNRLRKLSGNEGAKKMFFDFETDVSAIRFDQGIIDIDTPEDYEQLKKHP